MFPRWLQLINHHKRIHNEEDGRGLTITFLVGALRDVPEEPEEDKCISELTDLIYDMIENTPDEYVLQLRRCRRLREPVVESFEDSIYRPAGAALQSQSQER